MSRRAWIIAASAGAVSVALHAGGLIALAPEVPETLSGGPTQLAMIGNSFEDAVAGTVSGATDPQVTMPVERAALANDPPQPTEAAAAPIAPRAPTPPVPAATAPTTALSPAVPAAPTAAIPVASASPGALPATDPQVLSPAEAPPVASPDIATTAPAATPDTIIARAAPEVQTPGPDTPRPQQRIARPPHEPEPSQQAPAPQGSAQETTQAGEASGAPQGSATRTQQGADGQAASDGRAAAQYPQLVNRHLSRLRRPNARFNGAAVVAFTLSENGGLAGLSIARSSGNAEFDRIALAHIQRAAPFPPPPAGAQRSFNVTVRGR